MSRTHVFSLLILFVYSACRPARPEQPLTVAEVQKFALDVQEAFAKRRPAVLDNIFDQQEFARKMAAGLGVKKLSKNMMVALKSGLKNTRFGAKVNEFMGKEGSYELVKVYMKDKRQHMIFRLLGDDAGLNYHDFELLKRDGKIWVSDVFLYNTGEDFSATMGQLLHAADAAGFDSPETKEMLRLSEIRSLIQRRQYQEAQDMLDKVSGKLRYQKAFLIIRAEVAAQISDSLYGAVLQELEERYPDQPSMQLTNIERHFVNKNYTKALEAVNKLDQLIDKDPYLDYYRALMLNQLNRTAEAIASLEKLHTRMPNFALGVLELMIYYHEAGMKDKATALKEEYRQNTRFNPKKLEEVLAAYPGI